jgi:diguanylate cyclase (GGDEF)-like protein/PAS domain S-box-containing protein
MTRVTVKPKAEGRADVRRTIAENGGELIIQTNLAGQVTYLSASVEHITGFRRDAFLGRPIAELLGAETASRLNVAVRNRIQRPTAPCDPVEYSFTHKDGREMWFEARPSPLVDVISGKRIGVTDVVRDITAARAAKKDLEFANVLLKVQMEASPNAILVIDAKLNVVSWNSKFTTLWNLCPADLGANRAKVIRAAIYALTADSDGIADRVGWLMANRDVTSHREVALTDGRHIEVHSVPMLAIGEVYLGRAFFFQDVTAQKRLLADALQRARFDGLTGLANRDAFIDDLNKAIALTKRGAPDFAVMFLDLDRFKSVNDTFGHAVGDELLRQVAVRLRRTLREVDVVARVGGDEFAILLSGAGKPADVGRLAAKIVGVLAAPFEIQDQVVQSGVSIGIEICGPEAPDATTLLLHADTALYRAKSRGRATYEFFSEP